MTSRSDDSRRSTALTLGTRHSLINALRYSPVDVLNERSTEGEKGPSPAPSRAEAKRAMTAAAQACLAGDPAAVEKATRALEQQREAEKSEAAA